MKTVSPSDNKVFAKRGIYPILTGWGGEAAQRMLSKCFDCLLLIVTFHPETHHISFSFFFPFTSIKMNTCSYKKPEEGVTYRVLITRDDQQRDKRNVLDKHGGNLRKH